MKKDSSLNSQTITKVDHISSLGPNNAYKKLDSAKAKFIMHDDGTYESYIEHGNIHGVTPEMLIWFFKHLDCYTNLNPYTKEFSGPEISVYSLWHLRDHISFIGKKPGTDPEDAECAVSLGSTFTINEMLLQKHSVSADSVVYDLYYDFPDGTRIGGGSSENGTNGHKENKGNFGFWLLGPGDVHIGYLDHYFQVIDKENNVMAFQTRFVAGRPNSPIANKLVHKSMSPRMMKDWILHNIEESGETEKIVPLLYNNKDKVIRKKELVKREVN